MSLMIYVFMGVASAVGFVWRHTLADIAARAAAPIGAVFAALCLLTGSFWGRATWETWWEWDPRLTAMLILFLTYLAYLAIWQAVEDEAKAARLAGILCMAGLINIPIVRFSVDFIDGLHQTASLSPAAESGIHSTMLWPLLLMATGFSALFGALVMARMRAAIYRRRAEAAEARAAWASVDASAAQEAR
jgi:heme exporter protein C